jgi:prolyl oligopeptidase
MARSEPISLARPSTWPHELVEPARALGCFGIEKVDVVERVGAVQFDNPLGRLEEEDPAVTAWERCLDRCAEAHLWRPGSAAPWFEDQLRRDLGTTHSDVPCVVNGSWFWLQRDEEGVARGVEWSSSLHGDRRSVAVSAQFPVEGDEVLDWFLPSPDGRLVAVGVSSHGGEQGIVGIVDVSEGRPGRRVATFVEPGSLAWHPDSSGFWCARGHGPTEASPVKSLAWVSAAGMASWVPGVPEGVESISSVAVSPDGRFVGVTARSWCPRLLYVLDRVAADIISVCLEPEDITFAGAFVVDDYIAVTTDPRSGRGHVIRAPIRQLGDRGAWSEVVSASDITWRGVDVMAGTVLLRGLRAGRPGLWKLGAEPVPITLPDDLVVDAARGAEGDPSKLIVSASRPDRGPELWTHDPSTGESRRRTRSAAGLPSITSRDETCHTERGHPVRLVSQQRADLAPAPRPTIVFGYGGFNAAHPIGSYPGVFAPWLRAGGVLVHASLRGDGTDGIRQWAGGRRGRKQATFDDMATVVRHLVRVERATVEQLGLVGTSNGGLTVAAAITQIPELFRAAVLLSPITDVRGLFRERFAHLFVGEYGDPRLESSARWHRAYSPVHNVPRGSKPPATLIVTAARDIHVHPWHGRKFAAALSEGAAPARILLRAHRSGGHSTGLAVPRQAAEWLAFLGDELDPQRQFLEIP